MPATVDSSSTGSAERISIGSSGSTWDRAPQVRRPSWAHIFGPCAGGWRFRQPLDVRLETDADGTWIASDELFGIYGQGRDRASCLEDYRVALVEYRELMGHQPSAATRAVLDHLDTYLYPS